MCTSKPKIPKPTPVIERQAYRSPAPRESIAGGPDAAARRRKIPGMATSAQGLTTEASTTRRVKMGGDDALNTTLGGGGSPVTPQQPTSSTPQAPAQSPQTPGVFRPPNGWSPGQIAAAMGPLGARAWMMQKLAA